MTDLLLAEHSSEVEDTELASSPIYPGWPPAELPMREDGLPHFGQPHAAFHETEDEMKNRLSAQHIELAKSRLCPEN